MTTQHETALVEILVQKVEQIADMQDIVQAAVALRDETLRHHDDDVRTVLELEDQLMERDGHIADLRRQLEQREAELAELKRALSQAKGVANP